MHATASLGNPRLASREAVRRDWGWFLGVGALLMVLGAVALAASGSMTLGTMVCFGGLLLVSAVIHLSINVFEARGAGVFCLVLRPGLLGVASGGLMVLGAGAAALALTRLLAPSFRVGGRFRVVGALRLRFPNWGWAGLSGALALLLGAMPVREWPASGLWGSGAGIGRALIFEAWGWVMAALAARQRKMLTSQAEVAPR
jgi:uncharacterized membrane protein HdeD (DUF308 family)